MDQENEKGLMEKEVEREVKESGRVLPRYQRPVQNVTGSALSSRLHSLVTPPKESNLLFVLFTILLKLLLPVSCSSPPSLLSSGFFRPCDPPLCWMSLHAPTPYLPRPAAPAFCPACHSQPVPIPRGRVAAATVKVQEGHAAAF